MSDLPPSTNLTASALHTENQIESEDTVRNLCQEDPTHHQGYEVVYDTPIRSLSASQVYELIVRLRVRQLTLRRQHPDADDDTISTLLLDESEDFRLFATNSHPTIYKKLQNRETPQEVLDTLMQMIRAKMAIEANEVDEDMALAALQREVLSKCLKK